MASKMVREDSSGPIFRNIMETFNKIKYKDSEK